MSVIYLAGGCFWGLEAYLKRIPGVLDTESGYANGKTKNPTYEQVCRENTGHAETVRVEYDNQTLPLGFLLRLYFDAIDPLSVNRQGGDAGVQYRTGIYYDAPSDLPAVKDAMAALEKRLGKKPAVEASPLLNYSPAEDYHQDYLDKNPGGYCHIGPALFERAAGAVVDPADYPRRDEKTLSGTLSPLAFAVTQKGATEPPFQNEFWAHREEGIYVDITTGEPLFSSRDKFDSGCGWPSFSKPVDPGALREKPDSSHGMTRTEVKSRAGDAHLGHVFEDGPADRGGLRYCINSAALRFVKKEEMEKQGYGRLLGLFE